MTTMLLPSCKKIAREYHIQMISGAILIMNNSPETRRSSADNCAMRYLGQEYWKKDPLQMAKGRHAYSGFVETPENSSVYVGV